MPLPAIHATSSGYAVGAVDCRYSCGCAGQGGVQTDGTTPERTAAWQPVTGAGVPGFRLVIGVDGDQRAWVPVANALLDRIASGAVRAGSRVPPVTSLGKECLLASGTAARAFRALADEGVL